MRQQSDMRESQSNHRIIPPEMAAEFSGDSTWIDSQPPIPVPVLYRRLIDAAIWVSVALPIFLISIFTAAAISGFFDLDFSGPIDSGAPIAFIEAGRQMLYVAVAFAAYMAVQLAITLGQVLANIVPLWRRHIFVLVLLVFIAGAAAAIASIQINGSIDDLVNVSGFEFDWPTFRTPAILVSIVLILAAVVTGYAINLRSLPGTLSRMPFVGGAILGAGVSFLAGRTDFSLGTYIGMTPSIFLAVGVMLCLIALAIGILYKSLVGFD